jgi:YebC/PmpR family DNA-binding regulatory protein
MAGHSKWKNIRARKGKQDAIKAKIYTKLIRELTVAARHGANPADNPRLRLAFDKALAQNMPKDTIDRAISRGCGADNAASFEEARYEGDGPSGIALLVTCLTDNRNRTVGEVRHVFTKYGGNLGTDGSVSYLFKLQGILSFPPKSNEDKIMQIALDVGALDVITNDDGRIDVTTSPEDFTKVRDAMIKAGLKPDHAEVTMDAAVKVPITDKSSAEKAMNLIEALEDLDDVQNVYSNADIADELLE